MKEEYKEIAPYDDSAFQQHMARLIKEPGFENAIKYVMPDADFGLLAENLKKIESKNQFQHQIMFGILKLLESKTTAGVTDSGFENLPADNNVLFITNHRDIVLDASFLGL
ncbi:MAG: acyltransferase, partial [Muribaculaceae bacterium]|nr:acyltransferase [Muribaculaceae bacterium]